MKRIISLIIAAMMLLSLTAFAEVGGTYNFGLFSFDGTGGEEYSYDRDSNYVMIDYGPYVITVEYFDLEGNGFGDAYFAENLADPTPANIIDLLLDVKYGPECADPIYSWYNTGDTYDVANQPFIMMYTGQLLEDMGAGNMASAAFYGDGCLLLFECISFDDHTVADMQQLCLDCLPLLTYNGAPIVLEKVPATAPVVNPFAGIMNNATAQTETTEEAAEETSEAYTPSENDFVMGSFTFDTSDAVSYEYNGVYLILDYDDKLIMIEHGTFEEFGTTFEEISGGTMTCLDMAELLYEGSDYADPASDTYTGCYIEASPAPLALDGVYFTGNLTAEYGGGYVTGTVIVTEEEILFYECLAFSPTLTEADMDAFREESLGNLRYNGVQIN